MYMQFKEGISTVEEKQRVAKHIAHTFSQQWFGNLVTPEWWSYNWLSEGFGAYFQYLIASKTEPDWNLMDQFNSEIVQTAMSFDGYNSTRPMTYNLSNSQPNLYDQITYNKGAN